MRSSVAESRPSGNFETQSPVAVPRSEFRSPRPQHQIAHPAAYRERQRSFSLAPSEGWLAILLLAIALYSVVFSIISSNWVDNSFILLWSAAAGLLVGLCVAKIQRFPQAILHLAACLTGYWLSIYLTSVLAYHISWLVLLGNLRAVIGGGLSPSGAPGSEIVFLFYLTFLSFFLGYFGAWLIYRAHLPWLVALVYCAIMLVNLNYAKQDLSYLLVIMLGALILLIARIQLVNQVNRWINEGLHTDRAWLQEISRRFVQVSSLLMLLILVIAWVLPSLAQPGSGVNFWNGLDNAWNSLTHGQFPLGGQGSLFQPFQPATNFFGDQLSITGSVNLPTGEVLSYTSNAAPQSQYLEGFTYDRFDGHTWTSSASNQSQQFPASAQLPLETISNFNQVTTTVNIVQPPEGTKHYIFAPARPASFNVRTALYGNGIIAAWTQQGPLTQGERYRVISDIPTATAQDLSTVLFPQDSQNLWSNDSNFPIVQQYYLQKPTDLPPSVRNTALQWTRETTNVYDAMRALEAHLSDPTQFTYSVENQPVPGNVDAVAWLLQTHKGYCTYYASAMTIMARLLGIPARIVNGFSQGQYDSQHKVWVVNGSDAHSWVQVYFPGFGWINFDPTPGFSLNGASSTRPKPTSGQSQPPTSPHPTPTAGHQKTGPQHKQTPGSTGSGAGINSPGAQVSQELFLGLSLLILATSILIFAFALFNWYKERWLNTAATVASTMFWRVCRLASWAGLPPRGWQTPYEYNRVLSRHFPRAATPLRRVTDLFVRERWAAPHELPGAAEEQALEKLWPQLRNTLFRSILKRRHTN
jgi:transglutaminase-like putative cysteine protease